MELNLGDEDKKYLCESARQAIASRFSGKPAAKAAPPPGSLQEAGVFVTLRKAGSLRGCIGRMTSRKPLADTVREMAVAAAFEDPRFPSVEAGELPIIDIEISVLGPVSKMGSESDLVIGRHGLYIFAFGRSGVLLPQVATEQGWGVAEFLDNVCLKAGLPRGTWKHPDAEVYLFEGLVFGEKE